MMMRNAPSPALLALVLVAALGGARAADAPAAAASAPANTIRQAIAGPIGAAQDKVKAAAYADALVKLKEAEAVGNLTPYEQYVVQRIGCQAAIGAGDMPLAIRNFDAVLASPFLPEAERKPLTEAYIRVLYRAEEYARDVVVIRGYLASGGTDALARSLLPQALILAKDYAGAAAEFTVNVNADIAAQRKPAEKLLRQLASAQVNVKDDAGYAHTLELLAEYYPTADYWSDVVSRAISPDSGTVERLKLDNFRLQLAALGYSEGGNRLGHAYLAQRAGFPAEAKTLLEEGLAKKAFSTTDATEATKMLAAVTKSVNQDRGTSASNETAAKAAKDGDSLVGLGLALVFDGQGERGIGLMEAGIAKGGLKRPDDARLHLGVALFHAGRFDDARRAFEGIKTGDVAPLAHAWSLLAKIGGKVQPAAASQPAQ